MINKKEDTIPDTGISGLYEVILATDDLDYACRYFADFGYKIIQRSSLSSSQAKAIYGYESAVESIRLQNGSIDSHGLLRILKWDTPLNEGLQASAPRTIGQRISVMMTQDIFRLHDIYTHSPSDHSYIATEPVADDIFGINGETNDFFKRPIIVRENAVYSPFFNHIFFQRYGYLVEGYGTIDKKTHLKTSEFTHHDFFINASSLEEMSYLSEALGLIPEDDPVIDDYRKKGPRQVFMLQEGEGHWYQGFVSPNNICGKLKFFIPTTQIKDKSHLQQIGSLGVTLHSFYTDKLDYVHDLLGKQNIVTSTPQKNEFGELSFIFTGPGGCHWQIIEKQKVQHQPKRTFEITYTKE